MTNNRNPLLPNRHPEKDLFVCDITDAVPKGDMSSMEHPVFSLSTKPDMRARRYDRGENWMKISPSPYGIATVHDRDILVYCISQCMAALKEGRKVSKTMRFKAYDLLVATNRQTSGRGYDLLKDALRRLQGTQIETNIRQGGKEHFKVFGLVDSAEVMRETRDGRMIDVEITLSDWVFDAIENNHVLTLNRRYFFLRKPLERRLYELARKHCGHQNEWRIGIENLREKCGSSSTTKEFRRLVEKIVDDDNEFDHMPDYKIKIDNETIIISQKNKKAHEKNEDKPQQTNISLKPETFEKARKIAPGWDIYAIEDEWREWIVEKPRNADAAFLGFCKKWYERRSGLIQ